MSFKLKFIVSGTPRSGTGFMSQLLTSGGVNCGHEMFFGMPGCGFFINDAIAESSWLSAPFLEREKEKGTKIIHITRDPLKAISSMMNLEFLHNPPMNIYSIYSIQHTPGIMQVEGFDRYAFFYIFWNSMVSKYADHTFKLEDLVKDPKPLFKALGVKTGRKKLLTEKYNSRGKIKYLKMKDVKKFIYADLLKDYAKSLGYNLK